MSLTHLIFRHIWVLANFDPDLSNTKVVHYNKYSQQLLFHVLEILSSADEKYHRNSILKSSVYKLQSWSSKPKQQGSMQDAVILWLQL